MLNPLPELLTFSFFAPFLLRLAVGAFFIFEGRRHLLHDRAKTTGALKKRLGRFAPAFVRGLGTIESVVGIFLVTGFLTQIAAIVGAVSVLKILLFRKTYSGSTPHSQMTYVLVLAGCLSLLLSGAGAIAVDLPF